MSSGNDAVSPVVRFAPSPTGYLHVGNARAAVVNWLFARHWQGRFMLRLDDTDVSRSLPEYVQGVFDDLAWLGLDYDLFAKQSDRNDRYRECQKKLVELGRLYPCYETPAELERKRKIQRSHNGPPLYDREALRTTQAQRSAWEKEGRRPHWRLLLNDGDVMWDDALKGQITMTPSKNLSDPVLVKEDGTFLYTFSSVVDDLDFGITHIIRGEDHVTNTAVQIQLFEALHGEPVEMTFAHLPLLFDKDGQPLSKRLNSFCLRNLREEGVEPMTLVCYLASLGSSETPFVTTDLQELATHFDLSSLHGGACVENKALWNVQHKLLHNMPYHVAEKRASQSLRGLAEKEWLVVREAMETLAEVSTWADILHGEITPVVLPDKDKTYVQQAASLIREEETWDDHTWERWTAALKSSTGRKGRDLAHPLRLALTGKDTGPEMKRLLPLLGKRCVSERLLKAGT